MEEAATIAAVATAMNEAGIGIVRVSGPKAIEACDLVLADASMQHRLRERAGGTIRYGYVLREDGSVLDEALVSVMRAPASYTGEDVVEINVHGGAFVLRETLRRVLSGTKGMVRTALPGEFTKRAFLNGKMDLSAAEAVQDMIRAQNDFALQNAERQLSGVLGREVRRMREALLHETAFIEASLDDPDVYAEQLEGYGERLHSVTEALRSDIGKLLDSAAEGRLRKDGIRCAIIGAPNTGKSTLLNCLLGTERAIVTDLPGTTRDVLEEQLQLGEWMLLLSDTAGIRETADAAEEIGVQRAKETAKEAALILLVMDVTKAPEEAKEVLSALPEQTPVIAVLNKADLLDDAALLQAKERAEAFLQEALSAGEAGRKLRVITTSLLHNEGISALSAAVTELFLKENCAAQGEFFLTNERHREALLQAGEALSRTEGDIAEGVSEEFLTVDLMEAAAALGRITGDDVSEELIDRIFNDFCMGK